MKNVWNSFKAAFAMFSKIPMPQVDWSPESLRFMLCFFPLVGAAIGLIEFFCYIGLSWLGLGKELSAAVLTVVPLFVTGGIHVDGFLDTSDAMASWQEKEKRLEILKDSHVGAFAVINCVWYFLLYFGAMSQCLTRGWAIREICLGFAISRCLSGISVISFPKAGKRGTVARFARSANETLVGTVLLVLMFLTLGLMITTQPFAGTISFAVTLLVFLHYRHHSLKYFGGITGDLSGAFVCRCELAVALTNAVLTVLILR